MFVRQALLRALGLCALTLLAASAPAHAAWLWDQDQNKIDDRMQSVESQGPLAAHVGGASSGKLRFALLTTQAPFRYGVYVGYDHHPTDADAQALAATGAPVLVRYENIDYIRTEVTMTQALAIVTRPGVTRIETIPMMYAVNDIATRTIRARDSDGKLFPSVWANAGITGRGVSVAILDTGVNDEAFGTYPGHEAFQGKFLGGGNFFAGQPVLNTPLEQSENPRHTLDPEATYHGTHVAGTAIGSGGGGVGAPGLYAGLAPNARLIDCKVLSDAGLGFGAADALDWLIHHKNDSWGLTGADTIYAGVDVANMSIGGTDNSDGTDASCAAVNAAARAGIVCCIATGNDGNTNWIASPCAADLAVSVGAFSDNNTIERGDDIVTDYSNEGPRLADGDPDQLDEMKPALLGSGTGILSALGDPTTDGRQYHHINGTSMACPTIAGVCALILEAHPGLSPDDVRRILEDTADHRTDHGKQAASASDPFGVDPNYHPSWGWGQVDAYAAVKEAATPTATQVVRIQLLPERGPDAVRVRWTSQREVNLAKYVVERAPDAYGGPGTFAVISETPVASPATQIHGVANRHVYEYLDADPTLVAANRYWYRIRWIDQYCYSHYEPSLSVRIEDSPVIARLRYSWTHNYSDGDLALRYGSGTSTAAPAWWRPGLGAPAADSVVTRPGVSFTGTRQHYFHVDLTADDLVAGYLPPSASNPWFLSVKEGGYVNTNGTVNDFSITWFGPNGTQTFTAPNPPTPTVEKTETVFWIPGNPATTPNHAPVFAAVGPQSIGEGLLKRIDVSATDPDGDPLVYTATSLPPGATFDAAQKRFEWTPAFSAAGSYVVKFIATDDHLPLAAVADTEVVAITVTDRLPDSNLPPAFDVLSDRSAVVGEAMSLRATARDPEGSALVYDSPHLPAGASLDPASGAFAWTPPSSGDYRVTFVAHDPGGLTDSATVVLTALDPTLGPAPPAPCTESAAAFDGVVDMGIPEVSSSETEIPFSAPGGIQRIEATLSWFGGPAVDLDLYLLDQNHNVVKSAASTDLSETLVYSTPEAGNYFWRVVGYASPDTANFHIDMSQCVSQQVVGVGSEEARVVFSPTVPNPFTSVTRVSFSLPRAAHASLRLYDVSGRLVRTLENSNLPAGTYARVWDRKTDRGTTAMAGMYFYRLEVDGKRFGQKVILAR